ncbi:MAG: DNA topoisomerase VI subunit B [Candidatus Aureabacteria bacterium]|nr:DNA topoisomerase VI subunit B [Candidatus Auribacterota bacterium]
MPKKIRRKLADKKAEKPGGKAATKSSRLKTPRELGENGMELHQEEIAYQMALRQREISVSEFFSKNRHLLGFDNPKKALLTTVKEAVDNSLDACEEAKIIPEIRVAVLPISEDRFRVVVEDNGPGIVKTQIPKIFGKLLYGSKFHTLKQARGQQGIGISAAGMYGQLTTGQPVRITSKIGPKKPAHYFEIRVDTQKNTPEIIKDDEVQWESPHGTKVEIELEARCQKGRQSVENYLEQVSLANPHVLITYHGPEGEKIVLARAANSLPREPKEIKPHPYGVELGVLMQMLKTTKAKRLRSFLMQDFSRVGTKVAREVCAKAGLPETAYPSRIAREETDKLYQAINATKIMSPPTDCLSPIGEELILAALKKQIKADFYTATTRSPSVYRGNPFHIEVGLAWGGPRAGGEDGEDEPLANLLRFANRVPLLYQQSACAITKAVIGTNWRGYGLPQARGALPSGSMTLMVHMVSVWVPFTSESKEAIAHYPEILKEIKLGVQEVGRKLHSYLSRRARIADAEKKKAYIEKYLPHIGIALREILKLNKAQEGRVVRILTEILEKSRKME